MQPSERESEEALRRSAVGMLVKETEHGAKLVCARSESRKCSTRDARGAGLHTRLNNLGTQGTWYRYPSWNIHACTPALGNHLQTQRATINITRHLAVHNAQLMTRGAVRSTCPP
jgi:hypothetical protein